MNTKMLSHQIVSQSRSTAALCAALFSSAFFLSAPALSADTIYQDDFSAAAGTLNGSTVQSSSGTMGGTLDATWQSPVGTTSTTSIFNYSGSGTLNPTTDFANVYFAFLPLAIETGKIYTLTVDIDPTDANSASNLGVGFSDNNTTATGTQGGHSPWIRYNRDGTGRVMDGATQLGTFGTDVDSSAPIRATLTLDTTEAAYTVGWSLLNLNTTSSIGSGSHTYTSNPAFSHVFLSTANSNGTFDNFSVTAIPEPASFGLIGGSFLFLFALQARRFRARPRA